MKAFTLYHQILSKTYLSLFGSWWRHSTFISSFCHFTGSKWRLNKLNVEERKNDPAFFLIFFLNALSWMKKLFLYFSYIRNKKFERFPSYHVSSLLYTDGNHTANFILRKILNLLHNRNIQDVCKLRKRSEEVEGKKIIKFHLEMLIRDESNDEDYLG